MLIASMSDLHLEFSNGKLNIPIKANEADTVLILAGDVGIATKSKTFKAFIGEMSDRFRHIIYILGNHEHYSGKFPTTHAKIWNALVEFDNVSVLEKESIIIDNVAFIGATMWTDMNDSNPITMLDAKLQMNDYNNIRTGPSSEPWRRKLDPIDTVVDHFQAREYIFDEIVKMKSTGLKVVVVTHMAPSFWSIHENMQGDKLNGAYATNLVNNILNLDENQPELWCHGHLHNNSDYTIGNTRVICNPRGYFGEKENYEFDPTLRITI